MKEELKKFLRSEMRKINIFPIKYKTKEEKSFVYAFLQAKFDLLMDIDRKFRLGAFYKKGKK